MWGMHAGGVVLVAFAASVVANGPPGSASAHTNHAGPANEARCDEGIPAAHLTVTDMADGVLLTYSTEANLVGAVQRLVGDFAARENGGVPVAQRLGDAQLHGGLPGAPPGTNVLVPGAHASVTNTATGARLTLSPVNRALRRLLRRAAHPGRFATHQPCPADVRLTPGPPAVRQQR